MARYALIVGINRYRDEENIQPLRFAVQDARQVYGFFRSLRFEADALMESEASCGAIEERLRAVSSRLEAGDLFLFYFAGHGYQWGMPGEERQYLLAWDADLWALRHGGGGRAVPMRLVEECTRGVGAGRVVVLDACRSSLRPGERGASAAAAMLSGRDIEMVVSSSAAGSSPLVVVSSCRPGQLSYEHGGLRGGLFTTSMLEVLSALRRQGKPLAFTTETNRAIAERMRRLAEEIRLEDREGVGEFWVEGDATGVVLFPGSGRVGRDVHVPPVVAKPRPDPEEAEVKEWDVEELEVKVEVERVEVAAPAATEGLPPLSEELRALRPEIAGMEKAIAELKAGTHRSLERAKGAVREAELQLQTFEEELAANEVDLPPEVREKLEEKVSAEPRAAASEFCRLAPGVKPSELLPFVARLRNVQKAKRALESVKEQLHRAVERKIAEIEAAGKALRKKLQELEGRDLESVLRVLWPRLRGADLVEVWPELEPKLRTRGYRWEDHELLEKVEAFVRRADEEVEEVERLVGRARLREAAERARAALEDYPGHPSLTALAEKIASLEAGRAASEIEALIRRWRLSRAERRLQHALSAHGPHELLVRLRGQIEAKRARVRRAIWFGLYIFLAAVASQVATLLVLAVLIGPFVLLWELLVRAVQGDAKAQLRRGYLLQKLGHSTRAVKWYRRAAKQGHAGAQYNLGMCYYYGGGVPEDRSEAVKWFRGAAEQGHAGAQYELGCCYYFGLWGPEDLSEAAIWYRMAAEQGHADAQYNLGRCYYYGQGVPEDKSEAVKWYRRAAKQGHVVAQYNLGRCYYYGEGVPEDKSKAVKWYRKAAEQGDAEAQFNLGSCYAYGDGVAQDKSKAVKWYRKAAEQGHVEAQYNLGLCYDYGKGVWWDRSEAVKWYRKAAEQGLADAQYNLGWCYDHGEGVAEDKSEAVKWYRKAAEQGYAAAQNNLGWCYDHGEGVAEDKSEAVKWYRKAAEQGDVVAQYNLGRCYELGDGVPEDKSEAVKWYRKAAEQGHELAVARLRELE